MAEDFYDIPGDVLKEAEDAASFKLNVPESVRADKHGNRYWFEAGTIKSAQRSRAKDVPVTIFSMQININAEGSGKNINKPLSNYMRINYPAVTEKKEGGQLTMSRMSIHKLNTLFRSLGLEGDRDDGGYSKSMLSEYFPLDTDFNKEVSPLVNRVVYFEVKQPPDGETDKNGRPLSAEITKF